MTPEIILLNDLKIPQKWGLAFPMPLIKCDLANKLTVCVTVTQLCKYILININMYVILVTNITSTAILWFIAWQMILCHKTVSNCSLLSPRDERFLFKLLYPLKCFLLVDIYVHPNRCPKADGFRSLIKHCSSSLVDCGSGKICWSTWKITWVIWWNVHFNEVQSYRPNFSRLVTWMTCFQHEPI